MAVLMEARNRGTQLENTLLWRLASIKLQELRGQGMSNADISARFGRAGARPPDEAMVWNTISMPPMQDVLLDRFKLTRAERDVAHLLAEGRSSATIAQLLGVTIHTARRHTERVLSKLEIRSRAEVGPTILRALFERVPDLGDEGQLQ